MRRRGCCPSADCDLSSGLEFGDLRISTPGDRVGDESLMASARDRPASFTVLGFDAGLAASSDKVSKAIDGMGNFWPTILVSGMSTREAPN